MFIKYSTEFMEPNCWFNNQRSLTNRVHHVPGGYAAEDGIEVVAAQREEDSWGWGTEFGSVLVALTVCMNEMADLWQELLDQHGFIQTQAVFGLLRREDREEEDGQRKRKCLIWLKLRDVGQNCTSWPKWLCYGNGDENENRNKGVKCEGISRARL